MLRRRLYRLVVLISLYFVWVRIRVRVAKYDLYIPIVNCCIEYILDAQNNVVLMCGKFSYLSLARVIPVLYKTSTIGFVIYPAFFQATVFFKLW